MPLVVNTEGLLSTDPEQRASFAVWMEFVDRELFTEDALIQACSEDDATLALREPFTERVLRSLKDCKVISRFDVGLDLIVAPTGMRAGIPVTNFSDSNINEVSTHAMVMILAVRWFWPGGG